MGQKLVDQMLPVLEKLSWSGSETVTQNGPIVFKTAVDQVDTYRGKAEGLSAALRTIRTSDSQPYAFGGVAYILVMASAEANGTYYRKGLAAAQRWLERAQDLAPEVTDLNVIEALIYIYAERYEDARIVLDYLHGEAPDNYYLLRAEMTYCKRTGELSEALDWNQKAMRHAETVPQRLRLKSIVGDLHLETGDLDRALQAFKEALHFDSDNAWLCHRISSLYYQQQELAEAIQFNERALRLQVDFPEAQALRQKMAGDEGNASLLGRLFN